MGVWDGSGISWAIRKQSAPHSRQITTPTPHHSIFTVSKCTTSTIFSAAKLTVIFSYSCLYLKAVWKLNKPQSSRVVFLLKDASLVADDHTVAIQLFPHVCCVAGAVD